MYQYSLTSLFDQEALEIPPGKEESHRYPFRDFIAISSGSAGGNWNMVFPGRRYKLSSRQCGRMIEKKGKKRRNPVIEKAIIATVWAD